MKRSFKTDLITWKHKENRKPLLVYGMRQVGKTFTISEFGREHFTTMHYLNFEKDAKLANIFSENIDPKNIITQLNFHLKTQIDIEHDLLFFDEIQDCPRALTSLKYFNENMPQIAVCAAGSLLGIYLGPVSFPVGKVDILNVFPMSFKEFLLALEDQNALDFLETVHQNKTIPTIIHEHLWERLLWYFIVGGLPEVVQKFITHQENLFEACEQARKQQEILINNYLADIAKHSGKTNALQISRIWENIPQQLARSQDASGKKFKFKDIIPGIHRYSRLADAIDWLVKARLIIKTHIVNHAEFPLSAYTKGNSFKLYLADIGLLGALSHLSPKTILEYEYGTYKGYFAENFIAQELTATGTSPLYSWQDNRAEVEFIKDIDNKMIPIEVKSGWVTHAKSLNTFATKYRSPTRVVFSGKNLNIDPTHQYYQLPLYLASTLDHFMTTNGV